MMTQVMSEEDAELLAALDRRLTAQVSDPDAAKRLARYLFDVALTWRPRAISVEAADTILGLSLGFRPEDPNDPTAVAGPMNIEIAKVQAEIARRQPRAKLYAQWEVARVLRTMPGCEHVVSIERVEGVYLSTRGVAEGVIAHIGGDPRELGKTAIVAHHDHAWRTVDVCRRLGIDAYVVEGAPLPTLYDPLSEQNFTRSADVWAIYDLAIRIGEERHRLIGA